MVKNDEAFVVNPLPRESAGELLTDKFTTNNHDESSSRYYEYPALVRPFFCLAHSAKHLNYCKSLPVLFIIKRG